MDNRFYIHDVLLCRTLAAELHMLSFFLFLVCMRCTADVRTQKTYTVVFWIKKLGLWGLITTFGTTEKYKRQQVAWSLAFVGRCVVSLERRHGFVSIISSVVDFTWSKRSLSLHGTCSFWPTARTARLIDTMTLLRAPIYLVCRSSRSFAALLAGRHI